MTDSGAAMPSGSDSIATLEEDFRIDLEAIVREADDAHRVLDAILRGPLAGIVASGTPGPAGTGSQEIAWVTSAKAKVLKLRDDLIRADNNVNRFVQVRQARESESSVSGQALGYWPEDTASKTLMYIGTALFGVNGSISAAANLLRVALPSTAPGVLALVGGGIFLWGFAGLSWDQRQKSRFYLNRFRLIEGADPTWVVPKKPIWRFW